MADEVKCNVCERTREQVPYFVIWPNKQHTCEECLQLGIHIIEADKITTKINNFKILAVK